MLTFTQNILLFSRTIIGSIIFVAGLNRFWPREKRIIHNDLIGWQLGILGTTYAVILGFMLYTVWTNFSEATLNVDLEANALRNVYRLAEGLPPQQRAELEKECRDYADVVLTNDWPAMAHNQIPEESHLINRSMWKTLMSVKSATPSEIVAEDHAISELSSLTEHRRTRLLQSAYILPISSGESFSSAASSPLPPPRCSAHPTRLHTIQVFFFTIFITLVLLAIADVNLPFRGWVHVSNYAFVRAQENMKD